MVIMLFLNWLDWVEHHLGLSRKIGIIFKIEHNLIGSISVD